MAGAGAGDVDDVVGVEGGVCADGPVQLALGDVEMSTEAGLKGVGDDLLQIGIADERVVYQARLQRIGAAELKRRRRAVTLGKIAVQCNVGGELVGRADPGIEVHVIVAAVEQWVVTELVRQNDLSEVETTSGSDRKPRRDVESVGRIEPGVQRRGA